MDQESLRRIQQVLHGLTQTGAVRVGFLLNRNGRLIAYAGTSHAFHPQARFAPIKDDEDGENVYMTGIGDAFIIGAVFVDPVTMETVRETVELSRPRLEQVLGPWLNQQG